MSFDTISTQMIAILQGSVEVAAALAVTGKSLNVKAGFKTRQEINVVDLPIALIVQPERKLVQLAARQYEHDYILFVGVYCEDRAAAPGLLYDLENAIEDALTANYSLNGMAVDTNFVASSNDMGMYHPVYFTSMQFNIAARK